LKLPLVKDGKGSTPVIEQNPNMRVKIGQRQPTLAKNSVPPPSKSGLLALARLGWNWSG